METCNQFGGKYVLVQGFPGGSPVKNPPANAGHADSIPGWGRGPGGGNGHRSRVLAWRSP